MRFGQGRAFGDEVDVEKAWAAWREMNRKVRVKDRRREVVYERCRKCRKVCRGERAARIHGRSCGKGK